MRIVNNNIEILRGETATYDVNVIDDKNGYPYTVENINNPYIEFTVKKSVLDKDPIYRNYINMSTVAGIGPYVDDGDHDLPSAETDWIAPSAADPYQLYKHQVGDNPANREFYYSNYDGNSEHAESAEWIQYNFNITFTFPYEKVSKFEVKTYKYQITLLGGSLKPGWEDLPSDVCPLNVSYSNPILKPHDFVVGGSLSE